MRIAVIDTETTGLTTEDQVCELAIVQLIQFPTKTWALDHQDTFYTSLIKPTCFMTVGARSTHHITDEELAKKLTTHQMMADEMLPFLDNIDAVAGHFLAFDKRMLIQSGVPESWFPKKEICTWRCAMHLWPELSTHKNQTLRYELELNVPTVEGMLPHRALPDALVTATLLQKMLEQKSLEELVQLTKEKPLLRKVSFGKNMGRPWADMDLGFLNWVLSRNFNEDVLFTAQHWLEVKSKRKVP